MTSCCVRLKRCNSSTKSVVRLPPAASRSRASSSAARSSFTPHGAALSGANSRSRLPGDHLGERRLSGARRSVKDGEDETVGVEHPPQELAGTEKVLLADKLVDRAGPHSRGQGHGALEIVGFLAVKQTHGRVQNAKCERKVRRRQITILRPSTAGLMASRPRETADKKKEPPPQCRPGKHVMNPKMQGGNLCPGLCGPKLSSVKHAAGSQGGSQSS